MIVPPMTEIDTDKVRAVYRAKARRFKELRQLLTAAEQYDEFARIMLIANLVAAIPITFADGLSSDRVVYHEMLCFSIGMLMLGVLAYWRSRYLERHADALIAREALEE